MLLNQELLAQIPLGLLAEKLQKDRYMLATAESCTGGLIAACCTALAGSSEWFDRGFITYSYDAKTAQLGVDPQMLVQHGAVSEPVVRAMAFGAIRHSQAKVSIAVTGIAGPSGGTDDKPVGTVWFGFSIQGSLHSEVQHFAGDRAAVRDATVAHAFKRLLALLDADPHV
jgi:nicotinamide-nucleotide amidase